MKKNLSPFGFLALMAFGITACANMSDPAPLPHYGWDIKSGQVNAAPEQEAQAMPEVRVAFIHEHMKALWQQLKPMHVQMETLLEQRRDVLSAASFDAKAFMNKTAEIENLRKAMDFEKSQAFASFAGELSPQERMMLWHHMMCHDMCHKPDGQWQHDPESGHHHHHGGMHSSMHGASHAGASAK